LPTRFIELAGQVNTGMPYWMVEVPSQRVQAKRTNVSVSGVAYRKDVDDSRESPALEVIEILYTRGTQVSCNDPCVPSLRAREFRHHESFDLDSVELTEGVVVAAADFVLRASDRSACDYDWIVRAARLVVGDIRDATRHAAHPRDEIVRA
jgi:UDP-N-acetyl-D-glucosamine dehydrogenase